MKRIQMTLATFQRGASAIEYALMTGLIAVVIVGAVTLLGGSMDGIFGEINDALTTEDS